MRIFRRHRIALGAALGASVLLLFSSLTAAEFVLFNHSPSMPIGFYVREQRNLTPGVIVTVRARDVAPTMARQRDFDDEDDRFIKRVAAVAGDEVCADDRRVFVNGIAVAERLETADMALGWSGCRVLAADELLLLGESENSFDGRYWGPTNIAFIEGVWRKL